MQPWTEYYRLAIPLQINRDGKSIDGIAAANEIAALFDPHGGGAYTFTEANVPEANPTHCLVRTQLIDGYQHLLRSPRNPEQWFGLLSQMAEEKGLPMLSLEEVTTMCSAILFDDECDFLEQELVLAAPVIVPATKSR